jgi:hypothetical protein
MTRRAAVLVAVATFIVAAGARAEDLPRIKTLSTALEPQPPPIEPGLPGDDYFTLRDEPAGFPLLGGDSDIGFQFGGVGTLTRFEGGVKPYLWNMDLVLSASVNKGPAGPEIAQQKYLWAWDMPALAGGRLRLNPLIGYQRTINLGYFGVGDASSDVRSPGATGEPARYFQFVRTEARVRELARIKVQGPWDAMLAVGFRYVDPGVYPGSKLAEDAAAAARGANLVGSRTLALASLGAGVMYDTRDDEIFPHRGQFHQAGLKYVAGFPLDAGARYAEASAVLAEYVRLARDSVVALRQVVDLQLGSVPFYDLFTGGPFIAVELPGGSAGVRGVPVGRYLGPIKFVANVEARSLFASFRILREPFRLGGDVFFDTGRVWTDYSFASPLDGTGLGLKYGIGAGGYLLWGQAALFRLEVAYSPDAVSKNPGFPVGIYVEDGTMF